MPDELFIVTMTFLAAVLAYFTFNLYLIKKRVEKILQRGKLHTDTKSDLEYILRVIRRL
jgi:hypothetical protein